MLENFRANVFKCGSSILVELKFPDVGFCGGRKTREPGENHCSKVRTTNKLNPHVAVDWRGTWDTLVRGKRSSQLLRDKNQSLIDTGLDSVME